jgi:hypothetical protein
MKENSSPTDGDMDTVKEGGGGGANKQLDSSDSSMIVVGGLGGGDARGKFPPLPKLFYCGKIKVPAPGDLP